MGQLVMVVLAVGLAALLVAGGINYINPDMGVRTETLTRVSTQFYTLEAGFHAYRVANRGVLPDPDGWQDAIRPYLASPSVLDQGGVMAWSLVADASGEALCLATSAGTEIGKGAFAALQTMSDRVNDAVLAKECSATEHATDFDGHAALILPISPRG